MALTLEEVKERLKQLDEVTLLELLEVDADLIVERFDDVIENNFEFYEEQVKD